MAPESLLWCIIQHMSNLEACSDKRIWAHCEWSKV